MYISISMCILAYIYMWESVYRFIYIFMFKCLYICSYKCTYVSKKLGFFFIFVNGVHWFIQKTIKYIARICFAWFLMASNYWQNNFKGYILRALIDVITQMFWLPWALPFDKIPRSKFWLQITENIREPSSLTFLK